MTLVFQVVCLTIALSFFDAGKKNDDREANDHWTNELRLQDDEEYLHSARESIFTYRRVVRVDRLNDAEVRCARQERIREMKMWTIVQEASIYLLFLSLLCFLVYSTRNSSSFDQVQHLRKYLTNTRHADRDLNKVTERGHGSSPSFFPSQIVTIDDYWSWLEESFVSNLRAQPWYNGDSPRHLRGFLNDKTHRLIGWPVMRQIRVRSDRCSSEKIGAMCEDDFHSSNEETRPFQLGWNKTITPASNSSLDRAFQYRSSDELDSYVTLGNFHSYPGGGYLYAFRGHLTDLRENLSTLHQLGWIDQRTRAVIIQLNLYNPNLRFFTSVVLLVEFLSTGGLYPQVRIDPIDFSSRSRSSSSLNPSSFSSALTSMSQLICFLLYMTLILYSMVEEFRLFCRLKRKYFLRWCSYAEVGIISCSWTAVAIYIWRYQQSKDLGERFRQSKGFVYINLQMSTYVNDLLTFLLAFCCFVGTLRCLRLGQYNRRLALFGRTLQLAVGELLSFSLMFSVVLVAFLSLFYFLFNSKLHSCSTFFRTAQMLFQMTVMKFDATELTKSAPVLGPIAFSLFILLVVFVCLSMFLSIINESVRRARLTNDDDQDEIFAFIWKKFTRWTGLSKPTEMELFEERDERMRGEYHDPIERFPEKIDQLLGVINRVRLRLLRARTSHSSSLALHQSKACSTQKATIDRSSSPIIKRRTLVLCVVNMKWLCFCDLINFSLLMIRRVQWLWAKDDKFIFVTEKSCMFTEESK